MEAEITDLPAGRFCEPEGPSTCEWVFDVEVIGIMKYRDFAVLRRSIVGVFIIPVPTFRGDGYRVKGNGRLWTCVAVRHCDGGHR